MSDSEYMRQLILNGMKHEIEQALAEEMKDIEARIATRVGEAADRIAISVMKHYEMSQHGAVITIKVRKDLPDA